MKWIDELSVTGRILSVSAGDALYYEGLPGGDLYVVIDGRVGLYTDIGSISVVSGQVRITEVTAGGFFGVEGFFDENVLLCTAKAEIPSRLLRLARENALPLVQSSPEAMYYLIQAMTTCLRGLKGSLSSVISTQKDEIQANMVQIAEFSEMKTVIPVEPPAPLRPAPPFSAALAQKAPAYGTPARPEPKPPMMPPAKAAAKPVIPSKPTPKPAIPAMSPKTAASAKPAAPASAPAEPPKAVNPNMEPILPAGHPRYDVVAPETHARFLTSKAAVCPCCKQNFNDFNILNFKLKTREVKSDMRIIHQDIETLWYSIRVCPNCNAAGLTQVFGKFTGREEKLLRLSNYADEVPKFPGFSRPRALNEVLESYYLALRCVKHIDNDPLNRAQLWRRLMWLYDDIGDTSLQAAAMETTLDAYQDAYQSKHLNASESFHLSIVLGDLFSRKGDRNNAYKYFFEAIHGEDKSNQVLIRHAQDMIADLRKE